MDVINKILDISYPHKKSRPYFMGAMAVILLAFFLFLWVEKKESEAWLAQFHQELGMGVSLAHIEFGDFPARRNNVICAIQDQNELKTLVSYLENSELRSNKGHVLPVLEFEIDFELSTGSHRRLLGWILDGHPNDIFLERTLWQPKKDGVYSRQGSHSIKISGAATWIMSVHNQCIKKT